MLQREIRITKGHRQDNDNKQPDFSLYCYTRVYSNSVIAEKNIQALKRHSHVLVVCLCRAAEKTERWR